MRTKLAVNVLAGLVAVPLFALTTSVYATPTLFLSDGVGDTVEISENSTLNTDSSVPGTVSWSGSLGVWNLNVSTGVSSGTGTSPSFDLNSIDAIISPADWRAVYPSSMVWGCKPWFHHRELCR